MTTSASLPSPTGDLTGHPSTGDSRTGDSPTGDSSISVFGRWTNEQALRLVLRANATSSALFGLAGAIGARYWSDRLGIDHVAITLVVSIGLVLFAAEVVRISRLSANRLRSASLQVSIADLGWVAASIFVVALGMLTTFGVVAALIVAAGVGDFALAQLWLRRRMTTSG